MSIGGLVLFSAPTYDILDVFSYYRVGGALGGDCMIYPKGAVEI